MKLRMTPGGLIAEDMLRGRWARLPEHGDLLSFLAGGRDAAARAQDALATAETADPAEAVLPLRPRSMRAFMPWESHVTNSTRALVKHFFPAPAAKVVLGYERITGRTFPNKPNHRFREALAQPGPALVQLVADPNALSMPPRIEAEQVKGFALAAGKVALGGGVGKMLEMARANARNIPGALPTGRR